MLAGAALSMHGDISGQICRAAGSLVNGSPGGH
jgi:hypothetical protein